MYHYTECGLRNVWLENGYSKAIWSRPPSRQVSLWERRGGTPKAADRLMRADLLGHIGNNAKVRELIDRLSQRHAQEALDRLTFIEQAGRWKEAA